MSQTDRIVDKAYSELKSRFGGSKNDYFGLVYLENELKIPRDKAVNQVAFGGNEFGIDSFHFDLERKNLYIYQFNYSNSPKPFQTSFQKLIDRGLDAAFGSNGSDRTKAQLINQLRSTLVENRAVIRQICFRFIFLGDPEEADKSQVLDKLKEDLENKKYIIDRFFEDDSITLMVDYRSFDGRVGAVIDQRKTSVFDIPLEKNFIIDGPGYELMHIGVMRLYDLYLIYKELGDRFFERNIRYGLGADEFVNRAIAKAFKNIMLDEAEKPEVFVFNHNGITLAAENLTETAPGQFRLVAPRLLNGAQTITTLREFYHSVNNSPELEKIQERLKKTHVLCKIITNAQPDFITRVTINNNRQNPVKPWNLHAHDLIQLALEDKLKDDLQIRYERQENAFENTEGEEEGTPVERPVEMVKLAQTFLVSDGSLQRLTNISYVFEEDAIYNQVFNDSRLKADTRHIILCYKIHYRLSKLTDDIRERGANKYSFVTKARDLLWALLCQAVLNDEQLEDMAAEYGTNMTLQVNYVDYLSYLATNRCRILLSELISHDKYAGKFNEGNYSFFRSNAAFELCMEAAKLRWGWTLKRLK